MLALFMPFLLGQVKANPTGGGTEVSGHITSHTTWTLSGSPYLMIDDVTVDSGFTLTIEPGVVVQGRDNQQLQVQGHLEAAGTAANPIIFTSELDTDINQWDGIHFNGGTGHLKHTIVRYGGDNFGASRRSNIYIRDIPLNGEIFIENSQIHYSGSYPLTIQADELHQLRLVGNDFSDSDENQIRILGGTIVSHATLPPQSGLEGYLLSDDVTVESGVTLTVSAGATVMGADNQQLQVRGHLQAVGSADQPILFTSESNNDVNQWDGIFFNGGGGHLRYTTVRYGGDNFGGNRRGNIYVANIQVGKQIIIEHSTIHHSGSRGLYVGDDRVTISCTTLSDNAGDGITVGRNDSPVVSVSNSSIYNNHREGLNNDNSAQVDARNNWWGDASGPNGDGPGSGDEVSGNVLYDPWLTAPPANCENETSPTSTPTVGPTMTPTATPTPTSGKSINLHAFSSQESINVNWNLVGPLTGDLDEYELYRNGTLITSLTKSQYTDADSALSQGVEYCYQVKAVDSNDHVIGESNTACTEFGTLTIWVPDQVVEPDSEDVPVTINLANGNGLCIRALDIKVSYDDTIVQANGNVSPTIFTSGYAFEANTDTSGEVKISAIIGTSGCVDLYGAGRLFDVYFNVIGTQGQVSPLDFIQGLEATVIYDEEDLITPVPLLLQNGSLTVGRTFIRGDLNGDGVVNAADAALALDIASGILTPTAQQEAACDVNGDSVCNSADSSLILCYAAFQSWTQCGGTAISNRLTEHHRAPNGQPVVVAIGTPTKSGQTVTFPVEVQNASDMAGGNFSFAYDANQMTATGVSLSSLTSDFEIESNIEQPGLVQVSLARETPIGQDGTIFELQFTSLISNLDLASAMLNDATGRDFETSALQREINLRSYNATCQLVGDFDNDGDVDISDVQAVAFRWNTTVGDENYDARYDIDGDGDIDISDVQAVAFLWNTSCRAPVE